MTNKSPEEVFGSFLVLALIGIGYVYNFMQIPNMSTKLETLTLLDIITVLGLINGTLGALMGYLHMFGFI